MIQHSVAQNTPEWLKARLAIPTASEFARIVTPTAKLSTQADAYLYRLLAEWALGCPLADEMETQWMQRGKELEEQAMLSYAFDRDAEPEPGGFFTTDDGLIGASPDFIVGDTGVLELKCPAPNTHIGYMLTSPIDEKYKPQVQGQLYVCEREWADLQSYHPDFPTVIVRIERDEKYIDLLAKSLRQFVDRMLEARQQLEARYGAFRKQPRERRTDEELTAAANEFLTDADVDDLIRAKFPEAAQA